MFKLKANIITGKTGKKKRILIVDGDEKISDILKMRLVHAGYAVECAGDEEKAKDCLKNNIPHMVLLDGKEPGIDGLELIRFMRGTKQFKDIPVFIIAAESEVKQIEKALNYGAKHYIVKPIDPVFLINRIKKEI